MKARRGGNSRKLDSPIIGPRDHDAVDGRERVSTKKILPEEGKRYNGVACTRYEREWCPDKMC